MNPKLLFIGGGNMAASIIAGLIQTNWPPDNIMVAEPEPTKLKTLTDTYHIKGSSDNQKFIDQADIIILAVKPQIIKTVTTKLATDIQKTKSAVMSIAAGISIGQLQGCLSPGIEIIRTMPNTPALARNGMTGMCAGKNVSAATYDIAEKIMRSVGEVVWVENEDLINSITAISGSGPAYFFLLFEAMQNAAKALGLDDNIAKKLIVQTAIGSGKLAEGELDFASLCKNVTSKGGATEAALKLMREKGFSKIIDHSIKAAYNRAIELSNG